MTSLRRPDAVLLDVDGTLVDSHCVSVTAWHRAFLDVGRAVPMWRVPVAIGMDSECLLAVVPGDDDDRLRR